MQMKSFKWNPEVKVNEIHLMLNFVGILFMRKEWKILDSIVIKCFLTKYTQNLQQTKTSVK